MKLNPLPHEIESLNIKLLGKRFFIVNFSPLVFKIPLLEIVALIHFLIFLLPVTAHYPDNFVTVVFIAAISKHCIVPLVLMGHLTETNPR